MSVGRTLKELQKANKISKVTPNFVKEFDKGRRY